VSFFIISSLLSLIVCISRIIVFYSANVSDNICTLRVATGQQDGRKPSVVARHFTTYCANKFFL